MYDKKALYYQSSTSTLSVRDHLVVDLFPSKRPMRICDIGCGSGRFLRALKSAGHGGVGVDISETAVSLARQSGVRAVVGNPEDMQSLRPVGTGFDVVTALDVLEHLFNPRQALENVAPLLKSSGSLIVSVPNAGCLPARLVLNLGMKPRRETGLFDSGHVQWFTWQSLSELAVETGWRPAGWRATPLPSVSAVGLWRMERLQLALLSRLAKRWPAWWGYQLIVRLERAG